jgi:hypothetical protein
MSERVLETGADLVRRSMSDDGCFDRAGGDEARLLAERRRVTGGRGR